MAFLIAIALHSCYYELLDACKEINRREREDEAGRRSPENAKSGEAPQPGQLIKNTNPYARILVHNVPSSESLFAAERAVSESPAILPRF